MFPPAILETIVNELKAMFNVSCPISFDDSLDSRGKYYFGSKQIKVNASKQSLLQIVECICHEIVHHKQQAHGKLRAIGVNHYWYEGQFYEGVPYKDHPWEHEANHYTKLMFERFVHRASYSLLQSIREIEAEYHRKTINARQ